MANPLDPNDKAYTLSELVARMGPATPEEVFEMVDGHERSELIAAGADVATSRIETDCARDYGRALEFWQNATDQQKGYLLGMSDDLLRIAIWAALRGQELAERREQQRSASATSQEARRAAAEEARRRARARRNQLHRSLAVVVGGDGEWSERLAGAYGSAASDASLAQSLKDLVSVGRRLLASEDPKIAARRKRTGLDEAALAATEALAQELRDKGEAAESTQQASLVTQGEVDLWDGINLVLYESIVDIFDAARESDRTIPRLVPRALARFFRQGRRKKPEPEAGGGDAGGGNA